MSQYLFFVKREVWEHRTAFITTPMVFLVLTSVLLVLALTFGDASTHMEVNFSGASGQEFQFDYSSKVVREVDDRQTFSEWANEWQDSPDLKQAAFIIQAIPYALFWILMLVIGFGYDLSCLSADRKDGSILFWKSLPVSETQSVLSKLFAAAILLPAIAWSAGFILSIVLFVIVWVAAQLGPVENAAALVWQHQTLLSTGVSYMGSFVAGAIWILPVTAWCMFASAAAKRVPFFVAILPLAVLVIAEKILLGSTHLIENIVKAVAGILPGSGTWLILSPGWSEVVGVFASAQFWIGLVLSVAFLTASIWLRENRFESH